MIESGPSSKARRPRRLADNLAGLDARKKKTPLPDWVVGLIAWLGAPAVALLVVGLACFGLALLFQLLAGLAHQQGWLP